MKVLYIVDGKKKEKYTLGLEKSNLRPSVSVIKRSVIREATLTKQL